jgi:hypothetical protein
MCSLPDGFRFFPIPSCEPATCHALQLERWHSTTMTFVVIVTKVLTSITIATKVVTSVTKVTDCHSREIFKRWQTTLSEFLKVTKLA